MDKNEDNTSYIEENIIKTDKTREAMAIDIDDLCHLLVEYDDHSTEWLSTGEISIRLKA